MNILLFLIPVSMVGLGVALWFFIWAVKRGQFEDMDTPGLDILREDEHDRPLAPRRVAAPPVAAVEASLPSESSSENADASGSNPDRHRGPQD